MNGINNKDEFVDVMKSSQIQNEGSSNLRVDNQINDRFTPSQKVEDSNKSEI